MLAMLVQEVGTEMLQGEAVERFADWLTTLTVEREVANGTGGGAGKAKIVLCGHRLVYILFISYRYMIFLKHGWFTGG